MEIPWKSHISVEDSGMKRLGGVSRLALFLLCTQAVYAAPLLFSGIFDPANWTFMTGGDGWVDTSGAPNSITLAGSDSGLEQPVVTSYLITVPSDVVLDFNWSYVTYDEDGPSYDPAGYSINGVWVQLTANSGADSQFGFISGLSLSAGDTFAFEVRSSDDIAGRAVLSISGGEIPEPGSVALFGAGLLLIALRRRKSAKLSAS